MGLVARYFAHDPWIVGYDLMNEPFSSSVLDVDHHRLDAQIECLYIGRGRPGEDADLHQRLTCPPDDPVEGLIPTIEAADPRHLVFYEPDIYTAKGAPNDVGPMHLPRLVFNFHSYCPDRSPVTGDPTDPAACAAYVLRAIGRHEARRATLARTGGTAGTPVFMSEFGASGSVPLLDAIVGGTNPAFLSWCYWAWKYYADPTGSADEALVTTAGALKPTAQALAEPYPEAVAGTPEHFEVDPATHAATLS